MPNSIVPSEHATHAVRQVQTDARNYLGRTSLDIQIWERSAFRETLRVCQDAALRGQAVPQEQIKDALLAAARAGYEPGVHCHFVFFGGRSPKLTVLTSYRGVFDTLNSRPELTVRPPQVVREGDEFEFEPDRLDAAGRVAAYWRHVPDPSESTPLIGAYCVYSASGEWHIAWASRSYVEAVKQAALRRAGGDSPWKGPFEHQMWRKTALLLANKYVPQPVTLLPGDILPGDAPVDVGEGTAGEDNGTSRAARRIRAGRIVDTQQQDLPPPPPPDKFSPSRPPVDEPDPVGNPDGSPRSQAFEKLMDDVRSLPGPEFRDEMLGYIRNNQGVSAEERKELEQALFDQADDR